MVEIKVCGVTRQEDAELLVSLGVEAMGLNFYDKSPRHVTLEQARKLSDCVAGSVRRMGVFVNPPAALVREAIDSVGLDVLQFHGDEDDVDCAAFGVPYVKVLRVRGPVDGLALQARYPNACALFLDTYVAGNPGGTGQTFDLAHWPAKIDGKFVLAGGLTPENVGAAIDQVKPWGVDVAGGVEGPTKGVKDAERVTRFVEEVRNVRTG